MTACGLSGCSDNSPGCAGAEVSSWREIRVSICMFAHLPHTVMIWKFCKVIFLLKLLLCNYTFEIGPYCSSIPCTDFRMFLHLKYCKDGMSDDTLL